MATINAWGSQDPAEETKGGTAKNTYTTGDILYSDSANSLAKRGIGATNEVLAVVGGVPDWATVAASGGNDWTLISTTSPTSGATVQITSGMGTAYEDYMFIFDDVTASTTAIIDMAFSIDAGVTYNGGGRGHRWEQDQSTSPVTGWGSDPVDFAQAGTSGGYTGYVLISGNRSTYAPKCEICVQGDEPCDSYFYFGSIPWISSALGGGDIDAVEFSVSAGTFASGDIYLYGR